MLDLVYVIRRSIFLFILSLNSSESYSRAFNRDSSSKLMTEGSIDKGRHGDYVCLSLARN